MDLTNHLIVDIETRPNKKLEKLFRTTYPHVKNVLDSMAVNQDFCEIVCIGLKQVGTEQIRILDSIEELGKPEWSRLLTQMTLAGHNSKKFDVPIIIKRGLQAGISLPYRRLMDSCKPWGYADRHIDTMEALAMDNKWVSLDTYLQIYCGVKKKTKGADFFINASKKALKEHCKQDLLLTEQLFTFFKDILV